MPDARRPAVGHVLMTADAVGGVWTYAVDLARALGEHGVLVSLAVMGPPPSGAQRGEVAQIPNVRMDERPYALEWMDDPWRDVDEAGTWLLDLERERRPDVVHLNGYCHATRPWRAPVLVAGHSCVLSWWRGVYGSDAPAKWDRYAARVTDGLRAADLVVAPTAAMLGMLEFHYGPLSRATVIPNGRQPDRFRAPAWKEPMVLTAGRLWDQAKNVAAVAAAAPDLPWPVYVAGETCRPEGHAVSYDGVRGLGCLTPGELASWMRRAAIYALPARYEPFGLSILEAALAGCALVVGDIRSQREIWGDAAEYVPPDNRRAIVCAIERLAHDPAHRSALAARAESRALELSPRRMAHAYFAAYQELAAAGLPLTA